MRRTGKKSLRTSRSYRQKRYRSRYNGHIRIKLVSFERVRATNNGLFIFRTFTLGAGGPAAHVAAPGLREVVMEHYRSYRINKIKVEVKPLQTQAFSTAVSAAPDQYTGPNMPVWETIISDATTASGTGIPQNETDFANFARTKCHSSVKPFKRVFKPAALQTGDNGGLVETLYSPWLRTWASGGGAQGQGAPHTGWCMYVPNWNDAWLPGADTWDGEGKLYFEIKYTLYVEAKWPTDNF